MIINQIALLVNDTINTLYLNGLHFYQIIIGLFIFNIIIYLICKFVVEMGKVRFY